MPGRFQSRRLGGGTLVLVGSTVEDCAMTAHFSTRALSRARTGMRADEMTFAFPDSRLADVVAAVERTAATDNVVAKYAAEDVRRFGPG